MSDMNAAVVGVITAGMRDGFTSEALRVSLQSLLVPFATLGNDLGHEGDFSELPAFLREKIAALQKYIKDLEEPELVKATIEPDQIDIRYRHPAFTRWLHAVLDTYFIDQRGINFVTLTMTALSPDERSHYEVTVKKLESPIGPAEKIAALTAEVAKLKAGQAPSA